MRTSTGYAIPPRPIVTESLVHGLFSRRRPVSCVNARDSARALADTQLGTRRQHELGVHEQVAFVHVAVWIRQELHVAVAARPEDLGGVSLEAADQPLNR